MKTAFPLVALLAICLFASCNKNSSKSCIQTPTVIDCIDSALIDPSVMCTDDYDPVCGCDGVTYSNGCDAYRNGVISYTKGECCE